MKKIFMKLSVITIACLFAMISLFGCQFIDKNEESHKQDEKQEEIQKEIEQAVVTLTDFNGVVPLMSDKYSDYLKNDYWDIKNEGAEYSYGKVDLGYSIDFSEGYRGKNLYLYISEKPDMTDKTELTRVSVSGKETGSYTVYNLSFGTTYYWQAKLVYVEVGQTEEKTFETDIHSFVTDDAIPHTYYVDGVTNVRELGGYPTNDGKTVKSGMLFRSGKLNNISYAGLETYSNLMKIKTEIDLRIENDPLPSIPGVNYIYCGMNSSTTNEHFPNGKSWNGQSCYITFNIDAIKMFFEALADESNYPINYHCSIGTDRTGVVSFLIEALLDVKEEWIYRDYLLSNYAKIDEYSRTVSHITSYINLLSAKATGDSLSEKTYNYLNKVVGVSTQDLDKIIS
ncbi:MAG: tyrosine-protein phosphatase, partial [Firmicutes bacterium]|nr:tyrosine-protein phosphatase [Candidatus Caballimonas caccae]